MKGLILAGGKGTRLRPLTINTPKPVVPVANAPFLLYQIDLMESAGIDEIILSLSYQPRKIEDLLKDGAIMASLSATPSKERRWEPEARSRMQKSRSIPPRLSSTAMF